MSPPTTMAIVRFFINGGGPGGKIVPIQECCQWVGLLQALQTGRSSPRGFSAWSDAPPGSVVVRR